MIVLAVTPARSRRRCRRRPSTVSRTAARRSLVLHRLVVGSHFGLASAPGSRCRSSWRWNARSSPVGPSSAAVESESRRRPSRVALVRPIVPPIFLNRFSPTSGRALRVAQSPSTQNAHRSPGASASSRAPVRKIEPCAASNVSDNRISAKRRLCMSARSAGRDASLDRVDEDEQLRFDRVRKVRGPCRREHEMKRGECPNARRVAFSGERAGAATNVRDVRSCSSGSAMSATRSCCSAAPCATDSSNRCEEQLLHLLLERLDPLRVRGRRTRLDTVIDVGVAHPAPDRLRAVAKLGRDSLDRPMRRPQLRSQLTDQTHRLRLLLLRIPTRRRLPRPSLCRHDSILVSKVRSLQLSRAIQPSERGLSIRRRARRNQTSRRRTPRATRRATRP